MAEQIRDTKILFDKTSIHATEYSLKFFSFRHQVTIQAVDLAPDDIITFEVVHLESGTPDELCGCFIKPGEMPRIASTETLLCFDCDEGEVGEAPYPIRLTANNPLVILNGPQNVILRAKYDGSGLGMSQVWATLETDTSALLPGQDGCPPICCVSDPDSWEETGTRRCNLDTDKLEALMVDNCGNEEWQEIDDLNWQRTGQAQCTDLTEDQADYTVVYQETNQCGDLRWTDEETVAWADTGAVRCTEDTVERQQSTLCGDIRWVEDKPNVWIRTGEVHCFGITENDPTYQLEHQEVDLCGNLRWQDPITVAWEDTGKKRCLNDEDVEKQQSTVCGQTRWVYDKPNVWVRTGEVHCFGITENDPTYQLEHQEVDLCGSLRWQDPITVAWEDTGVVRCVEDDVEKQQSTVCGQTRWVYDKPNVWVRTGEVHCFGITENDPTYQLEHQEADLCGNLRWQDPIAVAWEDTGKKRCLNDEDVEKQQSTVCGQTRWVYDKPNMWIRTGKIHCTRITSDDPTYDIIHEEVDLCGETRWTDPMAVPWEWDGTEACVNHRIMHKMTTLCGHQRWEEQEGVCGYGSNLAATGDLIVIPAGNRHAPDCMAGMFPVDNAPDAATEEVQDCDGTVVGYLYPAPMDGASTPVFAGCDSGKCDDTRDLLGYGVDLPCSPCAANNTAGLEARIKIVEDEINNAGC